MQKIEQNLRKISAFILKNPALNRLTAAPCLIISEKSVFLTEKNCFFRVKKVFFLNYYATGRRCNARRRQQRAIKHQGKALFIHYYIFINSESILLIYLKSIFIIAMTDSPD